MIIFGRAARNLKDDPEIQIPVGGLGLFEADGKYLVRRPDGSTSEVTMQDCLYMITVLVEVHQPPPGPLL